MGRKVNKANRGKERGIDMNVYGQEIQIPHAVREIYPFESRWMDVQGYKMHYLDEGERSGMPTMVLLHGNPT
jgi:haloalkane dehalogenase